MKIAVIGATGAVGRVMLKELERLHSVSFELILMASARSEGTMLEFGGRKHSVKAYHSNLLDGVRFVLMSAGSQFSQQNAKKMAELGCVVIDNSSAFRMDQETPLIVPEVNGDKIPKPFKGGIIANPNCSTIQMVVCLKALFDSFGLEFVNVCSYQSVSGTGQKGINELAEQQRQAFENRPIEVNKGVYPLQIYNNVIPAIDVIDNNGHCFEEIKIIKESRRILDIPDLQIFATTARVPIKHCHSEAVLVKLSESVTRKQVLDSLKKCKFLNVGSEDHYDAFVSPVQVKDDPGVWVSRLRLPYEQGTSPWLQFWVVADNLRKGAATNAVQIMEYLLKRG